MKKTLIICLALVTMLLAAQSSSAHKVETPQPANIQGHVFSQPNVGHTPYSGPRSTPTVVDQISLVPINPTGYCWGITYDWDRDCLWVTQWSNAYTYMYAIQKTSPCVKLDSVLMGAGVPTYRLGIGYGGGDVVYMAGFDGNVYQVDLNTGTGTLYRSVGWSADEGLGFNVVDDALYVGDWNIDLIGYAQPAQTGGLNTWSVVSPSGMSSAHSGSASPQWLFTCNEDAVQAYFFQHSLSSGVPNMTPDSTWDLPAGMTQASTADCAFDGQYIYVLDQSGPDAIWVFDVGIQGGPAGFWDFETGLQGWTHTNGQAFPAGWDVEPAAVHGSLPDAGDSTMWVDSDAGGASYWIQDSALSPVCTPNSGMDWLKYGIFNYGGSSGYMNELHVGIKHSTGGVWTATELVLYPSGVLSGPAWDSVDVSAYASADFVQVYFYFDDLDTWGYYAAFDNVSIDAVVAEHDVGTTAILEPVGTFFLNDVVTPTATVKNHGDFEETFPVVFTITHNAAQVYADTVSVTLLPGAVDTAVFGSYTLADAGLYSSVSYTELVGDENPANDTATAEANVYAGLIPYVIIDVDPTPLTGPWLHTTFQAWGLTGVYTTNPNVMHAESLAIYQTVWICDGIYANYYDITNEQATAIGTYLATGRTAYCEGGDCWGFASSNVILDPLFGIDPNTTQDGSGDLFTVEGQTNAQIPQVAGNNWTYVGENNWIDRLGLYTTPPNGGTVEGILWNPTVSYWTGAAYDQGTWKTVGLSHELAGDMPGTMPADSLLMWIAAYLELTTGITEEPGHEAPYSFGFAPNTSTMSKGDILISYSTTVPGRVTLKIYDGIGRLVQTLVDAHQPAGEKSLVWNNRDANNRTVANGVYFLKLEAGSKSDTHKMIFVK